MMQALRCLAVLAIVLVARGAGAQEIGLGDPGHLVLSAERLFGYTHTKQTQTLAGVDTNRSQDTLMLFSNPLGGATTGYGFARVALDGFVARSVSVGGSASYFHLSPPSGSASGYALSPRVGYAGQLGPKVAIWPRAGITYVYTTSDSGGPGSVTSTSSLFALTLEAYLAVTLAPRAALLVGPTADIGLGGSEKSGGNSVDFKITDIGIQVGMLVIL